MTRLAIGDRNDGDATAARRMRCDESAASEHFVVGVRRDDDESFVGDTEPRVLQTRRRELLQPGAPFELGCFALASDLTLEPAC
ncbi:MAG: hypothetical protein ABIP61_02830 [Burkholderiaceae bacterium]